MSPTVGIDFGTTTSEVAIFKHDEVQVLSKDDSPIVPSLVVFNDLQNPLVGQKALNRGPSGGYLFEACKRQMGKSNLSVPYGKEMSPEKIGSHIFRHLKEIAEYRLQQKITDAVVTIPANFGQNEKDAINAAARMADDLIVVRMIFEPTAAALAYAHLNPMSNETILVYDFGGGTLDVTILDLVEGVLDVKSSTGVERLGGEDIDQILYQEVIRRIRNDTGFEITEIYPDAADRREFDWLVRRRKCKDCKETLSTVPSDSITVDLPLADRSKRKWKGIFLRDELEALIEDIVDESILTVEKALVEAHLEPSQIQKVLLVGGSSNIPLVQRKLKDTFGWEVTPDPKLRPELAVVSGAAIMAAIIDKKYPQDKLPVLADIVPHSIALEVLKHDENGAVIGTCLSELVRRNDKFPLTTKPKPYYTATDFQEAVEIAIFECDDPAVELPTDETMIHKQSYPLPGPPKKAGEKPFLVQVEYKVDGLLKFDLIDPDSGKVFDHFVIDRKGKGLSDEQRTEQEKTGKREWSRTHWDQFPLAAKARPFIERADIKMGTATENVRKEILQLKDNIIDALQVNDENALEPALDQLTEYLFELG